MARKGSIIFVCVLVMLLSCFTDAQTCSSYTFTGNKVFAACVDLPVLNSFLHWTYDNSTNSVQIAYRHPSLGSSSWTAWAINPTRTDMTGSQAFVAFLDTSGAVKAYTTPLTTTSGTTLAQGDLSFPVGEVSGTYVSGEMTIFASLQLPDTRTTVNQVWQTGPVSNGNPTQHNLGGDNGRSYGTLNLLSGQVVVSSGASSKIKRRNTHGILNTVSWGLMMPIGAMIARYLKVSKRADPAWFYLHVSCQSAAYIIGIAGFATGLKLGGESVGIEYSKHRIIGITLVCFATLQVLALFYRPKKDHKHRMKWRVYHFIVGVLVIILSSVNIFKGFNILQPKEQYKVAYVGVLVTLAIVVVLLEIFTWIVVIRRRRREEEDKARNGTA